LKNSIAGADNTAVGCFALENNNGGDNTVVGYGALGAGTGFNNTVIGSGAGNSISSASNVICIGASVVGANVDHSCFIGEIYSNVQPVVGTDPDVVTINSSGRLGRANVSSRRYKHDIKPIGKASEAIFALRPVSFRYNKEYDASQTIAVGLIAEEVAEVNAHLVGRNRQGEPESVRYEQINAMLLNEFLKEHCKVEEQEATITELKSTVAQQQKGFQVQFAEQEKQIKALASDLQRVSAQVEANRPARRVVVNEP
jgi:uncharacterized coiled-coil protein SlyX